MNQYMQETDQCIKNHENVIERLLNEPQHSIKPQQLTINNCINNIDIFSHEEQECKTFINNMVSNCVSDVLSTLTEESELTIEHYPYEPSTAPTTPRLPTQQEEMLMMEIEDMRSSFL